jgi:HPt (histidine-containing phosphotransfer) domain-containing protein
MPFAKVLLVADDEKTRNVVKMAAWPEAAEVLFAVSAGEGLVRARQAQPDVILLDAHLPGLDCTSFINLRFSKGRSPVVIVLAGESGGRPQQFLDAGVTGILPRPLDSGRLPGQIQDIVEGASLDAALANLHRLGGTAFVQEMIDLFLDLAPKQLSEARACFEAGNFAALSRVAHSLKSSAANLGTELLRGVAEHVEDLARQERPQELPTLLQELDHAFARSRARLALYKGRLHQTGPR